jgi:hypothetical protein
MAYGELKGVNDPLWKIRQKLAERESMRLSRNLRENRPRPQLPPQLVGGGDEPFYGDEFPPPMEEYPSGEYLGDEFPPMEEPEQSYAQRIRQKLWDMFGGGQGSTGGAVIDVDRAAGGGRRMQ